MGLMGLFENTKQPRYPRERHDPSDTLPAVYNSGTISLNSSEAVDLFGSRSPSGYPVNESTAMKVAAVYACVEKICVIASLPKDIYERQNGGSEKVYNHNYWPLLNVDPNAGTWTAQSMWERCIQSFLLRGDGLNRILRRVQSGKIIGIKPYLREHTMIRVSEKGKIGYVFHDPYSGEYIQEPPENVLHFPGFSFNGYYGLSVIQSAAQSDVGIALSADQYSSQFFANNARPDFLLINEGANMSPNQQEEAYNTLEKRLGGPNNRHKPLILQKLKYQPINLSSADAQLLETRGFQVGNICIAFGVPPQLIGAKDSTAGWAGSSIEQLNIGFAKYTLKDHITRMEQELSRKLFGANSKYYIKFDLDYFLEGDSKSQAEFLSKALGGPGQQGYMIINEARKAKGLPPLKGDEYNKVIISGTKDTANAPEPA